jgi:hypothetical protein
MTLDGDMSRRLNRSQQAFDTGRIFENATLGPYKHGKDYPAAIKQLIAAHKDRAEKEGWTPYNETINLLRAHYKGDVLKPEKRFAEDLRIEIIDALLEILPHGNKYVDQISDSVRFYSSVETGLDYFHGVDAWIEVVGDNGEIVTFSIDVTTDPNKRSAKADIVINQEAMKDPSAGEKNYYRYVKGVAEGIADTLAQRMKRKGIIARRMKRAI